MQSLAVLISRIYEPIVFQWNHHEESIWIKIVHNLIDHDKNKTKQTKGMKFYIDIVLHCNVVTINGYYLLRINLKTK